MLRKILSCVTNLSLANHCKIKKNILPNLKDCVQIIAFFTPILFCIILKTLPSHVLSHGYTEESNYLQQGFLTYLMLL